MPDRPASMYRNGRPSIDEFTPVEELYRRIPRNEWDGNSPRFAQIKFSPGMSMNRSMFSEPHHVLYPPCPTLTGDDEKDNVLIEQARKRAREIFDNYAVISAVASDLLPKPKTYGSDSISYELRHVPEECNYAHSELWAGTNSVFSDSNEVKDKVAKADYRALLRDHAKVVYTPGGASALYGT